MEIRPIRSDADHRAALADIEKLWDSPEGSDDALKLDILVTLVEQYEAGRWPLDELSWDPIDVLRYAIDELGHTQAELAKLFGSRSRASEVLSRQRALTVDMIRAVHDAWKIPAELLIRPVRKPKAA